MMGTHQMSESQVLDAILAEAVAQVFGEYVDQHGRRRSPRSSVRVRVEVGDQLPSAHYAELLKQVPPTGQGLRGERRGGRGGARQLRGVRAGRALGHRPDQPGRSSEVQYVL